MKTLAIIVNYKVAGLAAEAVRSVTESESEGPITVVVVDNSESADEVRKLKQSVPVGVRILANPKNIGFGCACNLAFHRFQSDCVLLLNPDARLTPGCLVRLQRTLFSSKRTAAVGPLIFWDDKFTYCLPPSFPPFLFLVHFASLGHGAKMNIMLSRFLRQRSLRTWRSTVPVRAGNLSGGHVLLKTSAVLSGGGLFDDGFFMYYEDTDLFVRLKRAGYRLYVDPRARVIHYYDQCGRNDLEAKSAYMAASHQHFVRKYQNRPAILANRFLDRMPRASNGSDFNPIFHSPFRIRVPEYMIDEWLFEWSPHMDFIPAIGRLGKGPVLDFTDEYWSMLASGQYFGRLGRPGDWKTKCQPFSWVVQD